MYDNNLDCKVEDGVVEEELIEELGEELETKEEVVYC